MAKQVTTKGTSLPATPSDDFEEFAGAGLENVTSNDLLVPRLAVLQALSQQVKKNKGAYIEGAEPGIIADLGLGELFPDGVWFLPVYYRKDYLEWGPKQGDGLKGVHASPSILDQCSRNAENQPVLPNGNVISETAQFFGLNLTAGGRMCFLPMASSQLKHARRWNTLAMGEKLKRGDGTEFTAPLFYRTYNLAAIEEQRDDKDWFGWRVERGMALPEISEDDHGFNWRALKADAVAFRDSLAKGEARGDVSDLGGEQSSSGERAM